MNTLFRLTALASVLVSGCVVRTGPAPSRTPARNQVSTTGSADATVEASAGANVGVVNAGGSGVTSDGAVECHGTQNVTLRDRTIHTPGDAIAAHGACTITLVHCNVSAGGVAVQAHGASRVVLDGSTISGSVAALEAHGSSIIDTKGSSWSGRVEKHGAARVNDLGGNAWK